MSRTHGGENENSNYYQNVNYTPIQDRDKKYANNTVLRHFRSITCISHIFATWQSVTTCLLSATIPDYETYVSIQ